jgi:type I restriction enzyme R subunit
VLYQQMRGRGTRRADHIRKVSFTMFDFVGNCDAHDDDDALPGGVVIATERKPGAPTPRKLLTLDIHDEIDPTTREWIIYDEQGNARPSDEAEAEGARLGARFEAFLAGETLTVEQDRLAGMIAAQLRAQGAVMERFTMARFTRPPFSLRGGVAAAQAAFGGEEQLAAFLDRLNAAVFAGRPGGEQQGGEVRA